MTPTETLFVLFSPRLPQSETWQAYFTHVYLNILNLSLCLSPTIKRNVLIRNHTTESITVLH